MATQDQIAKSMIVQLRSLDPSISAEVGTPERRIIDTVAQAIADAQVDLNVLQGGLDVESKYGSDLDNMLALLGFGRQEGTRATGYVTFSRETATTNPVIIKSGTTIFTPKGGDGNISVVFRTTTTVTLQAGSTEVVAPIEAVQTGAIGNVAANTITETVGAPIYGITSVNNFYPTTGGSDRESDSELKARFTTAGPFRNLAGTSDQFLSLALATKSRKANVIGPISKYSEYIQVPTVSDAESGGNGAADKVHQFTTALSNNNNAKHVYDNLPHFVVNDSGVSPIYYNSDYDYIFNINPIDKNKGDAARNFSNFELADPTSTDLPILYQPNVTFTNIYTGDINSKPNNAIAPNDVLLFEYSYMSKASRNDYTKNVLNCVDVYVNGEDTKSANVTIPRPGNSIPTFTFTNDETSAFYVDNYRRFGEPGRRPVIGNVFTPLYHQPVTELPNSIQTNKGIFNKGTHYWLVEEMTNLHGTVRARNGIEWSSTIPSIASGDSTDGPYTGDYINNNLSLLAKLKTALPSSQNTSATTVSPTYAISSASSTDGTATLTTSAAHGLNEGDTIAVSGVSNTAFNLSNAICKTGTSGTTIKYSLSGDYSGSGGTVTLSTISAGNTTSIKVTSTDPFPSSGYILIGSEIIKYSFKTGGTNAIFNITERGCFSTSAAPISTANATVYVLMEIIPTTTKLFPDNDYLLINSEQIGYSLLSGNPSSLLKITERGANGSYVDNHVSDSQISLLLAKLDPSIIIENYQYDDNIITLQSSLEMNKQVTTDVLAHKAKIRYFKPDVTIMYSPGANKSSVNESIRLALSRYFENIYFGNEIQLSDIIQTIHNVGGVDNVRWSKDVLDQNKTEYDDSNNSRVRLIETNKYGDPISQPVLELVRIGNGKVGRQYKLYLPYLSKQTSSFLSAPTGFTALENGTGALNGSTTYYYAITAINDNGVTTKSTANVTTSSGSNKAVSLTWNKVEGATSYKIYKNTSDSWTTGSLYLDSTDAETFSYVDDGSVSLTAGVPSSVNTATTNVDKNYVVSNFKIQYGKNEPESIEFDDLMFQVYDSNFAYSIDDIIIYGDKSYRSLINNNEGNDPSSNTSAWQLDGVNLIGFTRKINSNYNLITISSSDVSTLVAAPSFNNPMTITYTNLSANDSLSISDVNINTGYGAFNNDFQIGDDELAALPDGLITNGVIDISSVMTIRVKSQNTWNSTL